MEAGFQHRRENPPARSSGSSCRRSAASKSIRFDLCNEASACASSDLPGHWLMDPDIRRYQDNLRDELNGAALYAALAAAESDPLRKDLFLQLAQAESSHAQLWRDQPSPAGIPDQRFVPGVRNRLHAEVARRI